MKNIFSTVLLFISIIFCSKAQNVIDDKIKSLANELADQLVKNGIKTVTVSSFFYNGESTEFSTFLKEKISEKIVVSGKEISVIIRKIPVQEVGHPHPPVDISQTIKNSGIEAMIYGQISNWGEELGLTAKIIDLKTNNIFGMAKASFPLTKSIKNMIGE